MEHLPKFFLNLRNFQEQSGTTINTKTLIISTLTISPCSPKYPRIVSYAPHTKGRQVAAFFVAWRPSGTALTLRVRPKCLAPAYTILSPDLVKTLLHLTKILLHLTKFLLTYVPSLYRWQPVARTLICLIFLLFCIIFKNLMQIIHK